MKDKNDEPDGERAKTQDSHALNCADYKSQC